jgi:predicted secreted protein
MTTLHVLPDDQPLACILGQQILKIGAPEPRVERWQRPKMKNGKMTKGEWKRVVRHPYHVLTAYEMRKDALFITLSLYQTAGKP